MGVGVQGWGGGGSGRVVLIDNGRVNQSKAADAFVQVQTTKLGTNVGLNMLLNISSRYLGGVFWSKQLRGLPSSDGYFLPTRKRKWYRNQTISFKWDTEAAHLTYLFGPAQNHQFTTLVLYRIPLYVSQHSSVSAMAVDVRWSVWITFLLSGHNNTQGTVIIIDHM